MQQGPQAVDEPLALRRTAAASKSPMGGSEPLDATKRVHERGCGKNLTGRAIHLEVWQQDKWHERPLSMVSMVWVNPDTARPLKGDLSRHRELTS